MAQLALVAGALAASLSLVPVVALGAPGAAKTPDTAVAAQGEDLSDRSPAARKKAREAELDALTRDISLSSERQKKLKHEIDTIDRDRDALNADLLRTAQRVQSLEGELDATQDRLLRLHDNADSVRVSLNERRGVLAEVLAALQRIGRRPPPALAVRPKDALSAVRSAMMLNAVMPEIRTEADALASDLTELTSLESRITGERDRLKNDGDRLAEEKKRIEFLLAAKREQADKSRLKLAEETKRAHELADKATTLKDLIASLEKNLEIARNASAKAEEAAKQARARSIPPADPFADPGRLAPAVSFAETKGQLHLPVVGAALRAYGETDSFGTPAQGLSIATRNDARVLAPADGWVVYSGPFRSYGQLLILNAGDGYHILLAGMNKIDAELGQFVLAGEPVGSMGSTQLASAATMDLGSTRPVLYIEFRKNDSSIDPSPWWARPEDEKVRG